LKNWYNFHIFFLSLGTAAQKVGRKREKNILSWSQHIKNQKQCTEMVKVAIITLGM